jgi:hypothetical protein
MLCTIVFEEKLMSCSKNQLFVLCLCLTDADQADIIDTYQLGSVLFCEPKPDVRVIGMRRI